VSCADHGVTATPVRFHALDGIELGGIHYRSRVAANATRAVLFCCGGGIPARYYRGFASFIAEHGIPVLTFDYRGIGLSRPLSLRGFSASAEDWAEYDCGGAIEWLSARYPDAALTGMAHSVGTLLLGGAPNGIKLSRLVLICSHTGYFGDYHRRYRVPMALLWHGIMPCLTRMFGFFPGRWLGLGEDLPSGVALQWAARRTPDLRRAPTSEPERAYLGLARCAAVRVPTLLVLVTDDAFATEAGALRLLSYYPEIRPVWMRITPSDAGERALGHFGFFRKNSRGSLWPRVLAYLLHD
jgi:predicted alpha/beta hydrolase